MSSDSIKRNFENFLIEIDENEFFMGISESKVSFLSLSKRDKKPNIYSEIKDIPFMELNSKFKKIMNEEFTEFLL